MPNHEQDKRQSLATPENIGTLEQYIYKHAKFEEGRFAYVDIPLNMIEMPNIPVDHEHVEELAEQMRDFRDNHDVEGGNGQREEVLLAQIEGDDEKLHIIEGLHRIPAIEINAVGYARSKILMGSSEEEVAKMRMSGVKEHPSIRTSRAVTMIDELWQFTPWSEKLTSSQAFSLTNDDRSGKELRISGEEAKGIKQWAQERAEECNLSVATVDKHLRLIDAVDPEIIKNAREMHGKQDFRYFASANLKWLAKHLRGEFDKQKLVVEISIAKKLNSAHVAKLAEHIAELEVIDDESREKMLSLPFLRGKSKGGPKRQRPAEPNGEQPESVKILPPEDENEQSALEAAELIIVEEVLCATALEIACSLTTGGYVCVPNASVRPQYFTVTNFGDPELTDYRYEAGKWKSVTRRFPHWTPSEIHSLKTKFNRQKSDTVRDVTRRKINDTAIEPEIANSAFDASVQRLVKDTKYGLLRQGKDLDDVHLEHIFYRCLLDQVSSQMFPENKRAGSTIDGDKPKPMFLKFETFKKLLCSSPSKIDRRAITCSAIFELSNYSIAKLLGVAEDEIHESLTEKRNQAKSIQDSTL